MVAYRFPAQLQSEQGQRDAERETKRVDIGKHRCAEKRTEECAQCAAQTDGDSQIEVPLAAAPKPEQRANPRLVAFSPTEAGH
jgi:hypothetical protein